MYLIVPLILTCFYFGYIFANLLRSKIGRRPSVGRFSKSEHRKSSFFPQNFTNPQIYCSCGVLAYSRSLFDPRVPKLPLHADENLQKIFDLVIERFILRWFSKLSNDRCFTADVKAQLQHACSVILLRLKTVDIANLIEQKLLPCVIHHVEHLLTLTDVFSHLDAFFGPIGCSSDEEPEPGGDWKRRSTSLPPADEVVLQRLFSADHLHPAVQSRHAESLYLQGIVRRLLPHLIIPPGLNKANKKPPVDGNPCPLDQAFSSSQSHHQLPQYGHGPSLVAQSTPHQTQAAQCARAFLTEIIANHVLLPALDSIANPDSFNTVLLYLLDPITDETDYPANAPVVPLLDSYIHDWFKSAKKLPPNMRMEALLQQPKQLGSFVQFMKSINCTNTMTVLLLMFEVVNKIETESVSPALCERLRLPLQQLLYLLHRGRVLASEEFEPANRSSDRRRDRNGSSSGNSPRRPASADQTVCEDCGREVAPIAGKGAAPCFPSLLGLPPRLTAVIAEALDEKASEVDPLCVARLVHEPEWTSAYATLCATMERIYLPAYLESPEYLGRMGAPSINSSPKQAFYLTEDNPSNGDPMYRKKTSLPSPTPITGLGITTNPPAGRLNKTHRHSNSLTGISELSRNSASASASFLKTSSLKDDLSSQSPPTRTTSGRLGFRRRPPQPSALPQPPSPPTTTPDVVEMEELDFSCWRVAVPFYTFTKKAFKVPMNGGGPANTSSPSSAVAAAATAMMMMNPEQPDFSLFSLSTPSQGYYTLIAEREVRGKKVVSRVNRKYPEFYVLEQRLVEFHGPQISRRLPSRRYGAQPQQYLENLKSLFERYLRYLLTQPFLRSSKLMYTFLTAAEVEFTPSSLVDLRLGKFVKSVPILLAKEKGQFTDEFLTAFRASCFLPSQKGTKVGQLERLDNLDRRPLAPPSSLDHRLRSRLYWNNAGIPVTQKRLHTSEYCAMEGSYITSFYDLAGYLVDNFHKPGGKKTTSSTANSQEAPMHLQRQRVDSTTGKFSVYEDFLRWLYRLGHACVRAARIVWYEAVLALQRNSWCSELAAQLARSPSTAGSEGATPSPPPSPAPPLQTSRVASLLRRAVLHAGLAVRATPLRDLLDLHMRRQLALFLRLLARNDYLAPMLDLLKNSISYPTPPRSEREKVVRREKAYTGLMRLINRFHLQWFSPDDTLQRRLGRVFEVFQHGKWNKQLTYCLLDHLLLALFPDVFVANAAHTPPPPS